MKFLSLLVLSLALLSCGQQAPPAQKQAASASKREIYDATFKWTVDIPDHFEDVGKAERLRKQEQGANKLKEKYKDGIEFKGENIFLFKSDQYNYFEALYEPFDQAVHGPYAKSFVTVNKMIFESLKNPPGNKLDSASSEETVGGLKFHTFKISVDYRNGPVMNWWIYSRLFDKKAFTVNIITIDTAKEKTLLNAWRSSKFEH